MTLQTRLFSFFLGIVVLPLLAASFLGGRVIVNEVERRTFSQLNPAQFAALTVYQERADGANDRVQLIASDEKFSQLLTSGKFEELSAHLAEQLAPPDKLDYIVVADTSRKPLAWHLRPAGFIPGVAPPTVEEIVGEDVPPERRLLVTRTLIPIRSNKPPNDVAWTVVGGYYLDNRFVGSLSEGTGVDATLFIDDKAVSTTLDSDEAASSFSLDLEELAVEPRFSAELAGQDVYAVASQVVADAPITKAAFVVSTPQAPVARLANTIRNSSLVVLVLAVLMAATLGFLLARLIARPLRELAAGANAIAAGNYDQHIDVRSHDEVGELARSFNAMTERLKVHISDLRESREQVKRAYARFGEILRSTHDLEKLLEGVLEISLDTLRATRGLLMVTSGPGSLNVQVSRGVVDSDFELEPGKGLAGYVASTGNPMRLPADGDLPKKDHREPEFKTLLAVPLQSQERVMGVLVLMDKEEGMEFTEADMGTLLSLADQAGVAIENVMLHRDAERLAITDAKLGIWNWRYFQLQFDTEINRSARFGLQFSLMEIDIDNFKTLNDTHGHLAGDAVLIELVGRVKSVIRDIDSFARYGGEEFLLLLPETKPDGAQTLAEKIRSVIAEKPFEGDPIPKPISVTVSVGISCFPEHGSDRTSLLRAADRAMYTAKSGGRNRVEMYGSDEAA